MRAGWRHACGVLLALVLVAGPAAAVQVAAWGGMLVARSVEQGVRSAVQSTFDGSRPCRVCVVAGALRRAENARTPAQPAAPPKLIKVECPAEAVLPFAVAVTAPPERLLVRPAVLRAAGGDPPAPEPPPPRAG